MTTSFETPSFAEELDAVALADAAGAQEPAGPEAETPPITPRRKTILPLAVCALAINGAAAIYTSPSGMPSLNVASLAGRHRPEGDPVGPAAAHRFAA
ncbi:hypothetical protein [Bradyrhizobium yuanmingense]|uniref:hypothetical protein n=1 Tax=Bradyrhizobium yuanmingense TaxID=108015 RepID=UPI0030B916AA